MGLVEFCGFWKMIHGKTYQSKKSSDSVLLVAQKMRFTVSESFTTIIGFIRIGWELSRVRKRTQNTVSRASVPFAHNWK
jgi:hypothetical protein